MTEFRATAYHVGAMRVQVCVCFLLFSVGIPAFSQNAPDTQKQIEEHTRLAQEYIAQKKPELAIPELEKVTELAPDDVAAQGNLGVLLFFRGEYRGALPHLRAAVAARPGLWKIQALLGLSEANLHDVQASRQDLESAFPHLTDDRVQMEVGQALIHSYTQTSDYEKAASITAELLSTHPTDTSLLYLSYRLYSDLAGNAMLTLALTAPNSAEMHQVMARELARHGDMASAIANYRTALQINPNLPGLHTELATILYHSEDAKLKAEAPAQLKAALAVDPRDPRALFLMGVIEQQQGNLKAALDDESSAIASDPQDSDAYTQKAKILVQLNQPAEAVAMLERAVQLDPGNFVAHYRLSGLYRQQGKTEAARQQVQEYMKYKQLKDNLGKVFRDMALVSERKLSEDSADPTQ